MSDDHTLDTTWDDDDPIFRPATPFPGANRTLRRTISCASIDTIRPRNKSKGIRRCINEIAEKRDAKKKNKDASSQEVSKGTTGGRSRIKSSRSSKEWTRRGKATAPLQHSSLNPEDDVDLGSPDRLYSGVPSAPDTPLTFLGCEPIPLVDVPPLDDDDDEPWDDLFSTRPVVFRDREISRANITDVRLNIKPTESNLTIWDGLQAPHHLHKCRLFLQCVTQPYDSMTMPNIRLLEMNCSTRPVTGSHYPRPPVLQSSYKGATPQWLQTTDGVPKVKLVDGIHVDEFWRKVLEDDGSWGWYRDAYIPLSPRLFDKMDYREFKLVSQVWIENNCVEGELTFGISMLLRGEDMK